MVSKPIPYRCPACMTESPPSYVGRLVWLEQETGPVLCRYHRDKNGNLAPVEMEAVERVKEFSPLFDRMMDKQLEMLRADLIYAKPISRAAA